MTEVDVTCPYTGSACVEATQGGHPCGRDEAMGWRLKDCIVVAQQIAARDAEHLVVAIRDATIREVAQTIRESGEYHCGGFEDDAADYILDFITQHHEAEAS